MSGTGCDPSVRRFAADEWQIYRDLRLRALADAPDAFARTHSEEAGYPDERWEARLADGAGPASALALVGEPEPLRPRSALLAQTMTLPLHRVPA